MVVMVVMRPPLLADAVLLLSSHFLLPYSVLRPLRNRAHPVLLSYNTTSTYCQVVVCQTNGVPGLSGGRGVAEFYVHARVLLRSCGLLPDITFDVLFQVVESWKERGSKHGTNTSQMLHTLPTYGKLLE